MSTLHPIRHLGMMFLALFASACVSEEKRALVLPDPIRQEGFGVECESDEDCTSGPCTPHAGTRVCSQPCAPLVPCPDAWNCVAPPNSTDGEGLCRSPFASLCRPCESKSDCSEDLSKFEGCIDDGEGSFCSTFCDVDADCPSGYACLDRKTVTGGAVRACSRIDEAQQPTLCTCNAYLASLERPALCRAQNDLGTCTGTRLCEDGEWLACSAPTPSLDLPNGLDDDCDGDTDDLTCRCGDGTCDIVCGESLQNCPCDCATKNDGICSPCGENPNTSPEDCCKTPGGSGCGDGYCLGYGCGENPETCPRDCSTPCGNQVCERGETPQTCPIDCKHQVCGNHVCEPTDDGPTACPQDCAAFCGDCECDPARDESVFNCPIDCGFCGDGVCSVCSTMNESATTCPEDCCTGSVEFCNGLDDDCDGITDEEGAAGCRQYHADSDDDGLGRWDASRCLCKPEGEYRTFVSGDCDDGNAAVGLGTPERCNGEDEDCDGDIDEDFGIGGDCEAPSGPCTRGELVCDGTNATTCIDGPPRDAGTTCGALSCEDGVIEPPSICDGEGECVPLPRAHCNGFDCAPSGRCVDACASDSDCRTGFICTADRVCQRTEPLCEDDRKCIDEDWRTEDFCLVICVHRNRSDRSPSDDLDQDGVSNEKDLCPETPDPGQGDADSDGRGDACDPCSGLQLAETCNDRDDDCDGETDEGFGVGLSCVPLGSPCENGTRTCKDGVPICQSTGFASAGLECAEARCESPGFRLSGRCDGAGTCEPGDLVHCQGFPCIGDQEGPRCATTCEPNCAPGYFCAPSDTGGICAPKFNNGISCGEDAQCRSGHCVDGICCVSACETPCYTCHREDARGACVPAEVDTDPGDDCGPCALCNGIGQCSPVTEGPSPKASCPVDPPCGGLGRCDGEGACTLASPDTECLPEACFGSTFRPAAFCDGAGLCDIENSLPCPGNFACLGDLECRESCATDRHCSTGHYCDLNTGSCLSLRPLGGACGENRQCESQFCVDGVCCESNCGGPCQTCAGLEPGKCVAEAAGSDRDDECGLCRACDGAGQCSPITVGADPHDECDENTPCGTTGVCDGASACAVATNENACGEARCVGGTLLEARVCDGQGRCEEPVLTSCAPYLCANGETCATQCATDRDCQNDYFCSLEKTCEAKRELGVACSETSQCRSGFCADGRCCESACNGPCEACGDSGLCKESAGPDPLCGASGLCVSGECRRGAGERCEKSDECASGFCADGRCCDVACDGECESCASGACATLSGVESAECGEGKWCSAAGRCEDIDGSPCESSCPDGRTCVEGQCGLPLALGEACASGDRCRSGLCVDGVCCIEPCNGECVECVAGFCEPLPSGEPKPGICEESGGTCDGNGACRLANGAGCASSSECTSGFCVDGMCCGSACDGECERCVNGICEGVSGGTDLGTCEAPSICAGRDRCASGAGNQCNSSNDCVSGHCILVTPTVGFCCDSDCSSPCETCFGEETGTCETIVRAENPGRCEGTSWCGADGICAAKAGSSCASPADCDEGFFCNIETGKCEGVMADGTTCSGDETCASGFCVDGRCCETACDGLCERCNASGRCEPAASGTDPDEDCPAGETCSRESLGCESERGQICINDGECASGYCADGVCCDRSCGGPCESCIENPGTCESVTDAETERCEGAFMCDAVGACKGALGTPCQTDSQCASALCGEGGFCCASGCTAPCERCEASGACVGVQDSENPERCEGERACDSNGECVEKSRLCASDGDCTFDYHCRLGRCTRDGDLGVECEADGQCLSGVCREGRCCESNCGGQCETCSRSGYEGKCVPAEPGTNPQESCPPKSVCDENQDCLSIDGTACVEGNECLSGHCTDGVCCDSSCDGQCESCTLPLAEGVCTPLSGPDEACGAGSSCVDGQCLKVLGVSCLGDGECASTHCGDIDNESTFSGVCCESACEGPCATCTQGRCTRLESEFDWECQGVGQWCDLSGQCRAVTGSRCEGDDDCPESHFCSANACTPLLALGAVCSAGDQCSSGFCADGRCCESACDGACRTCGPTGSCGFSDVGATDGCTSGRVCSNAGQCASPTGSSCTSDTQCASGNCRDGVCCSTRCDGICERCNASGQCTPLSNAIDPGLCDGPLVCSAGQCRFRNGLECSTPSQCASGHCVDGRCCDGACNGPCVSCATIGFAGTCQSFEYRGDPLCGPELWCGQGGICADPLGEPCLDETQCPEELVCADPNGLGFDICSPPFSNGAGCVSNSDCESGFCVDGVCCSTACDGSCQACNIVGGSCTGLSQVTDTCPSGKVCINGACGVAPSPDCGSQSCVPGTECVDGFCEPSGEASPCEKNDDCPSGLCVNNLCVPQF